MKANIEARHHPVFELPETNTTMETNIYDQPHGVYPGT